MDAPAFINPSRRVVIAGTLASAVPFLSSRAAAGARVLHIDSYHEGNEWNDRIAAAVLDTLSPAGVDVRIVRMDTKRKPSEADKSAAAGMVRAEIEAFKPDVVTMSDDNAVKYVLMPFFRDADLPFVFCGLNWDASAYELPYRNTTGMVEVSPIPQIVRLLKTHARGERIGYLAENTPTKTKELSYHEKLFGLTYDRIFLVSSFDEWKRAFKESQQAVDMLIFLGVGSVTDWDRWAALDLTERETRIPVGTDFAWLAPYTLLAVAKRPEEQGRWAAQAALRILDGVSPANIPLTYNTEGDLIFNMRIAQRLQIAEAPPLAKLIQ
ncbi:MAG: ABC transporter substrate binding protein [Pseudomonadota bacterium]